MSCNIYDALFITLAIVAWTWFVLKGLGYIKRKRDNYFD